jgi:hydrogenase/urease accessory protein HupE
MKLIATLGSLLGSAVVASSVFAHEGIHSHAGDAYAWLWHPLNGYEYVGAAVVLAVWGGLRFYRSRRNAALEARHSQR